MNKVHKYKVAGACVTGISHLRKKMPCQDKIFSSYSNGVTAIALADGASTKKKSEFTILYLRIYDGAIPRAPMNMNC